MHSVLNRQVKSVVLDVMGRFVQTMSSSERCEYNYNSPGVQTRNRGNAVALMHSQVAIKKESFTV